jgi:MFS family permease
LLFPGCAHLKDETIPKTIRTNIPIKKKIFYGWWIVIASAILHFFSGGSFYYGFSVFFNPIRDTFHWTAAQTSLAFTLRGLETGIFGPITGFMVDKVGPRKLMVAGWSVIGLGFLLMNHINSLTSFYGSFLVIAAGMSFGSGVVMNAAIVNWFTRKRSRAMAISFIGPGICGFLAPLLALFIGWIGWRDTLTIMGITLLIIGIPLSLLFRHRPEQYGYLPDGEIAESVSGLTSEAVPTTLDTKAERNSDNLNRGFTVKEALKTRAFWLLSLAFFFQQMGTSAVTVHIVAYLESVNIPTSIAALMVTGMTLCSLIGRLGFGFIGDFVNKKYLIAMSLGLQAIGLFIFSMITADRMWLLIFFLLTFGPGFGAPIPLRPAMQADYFGTNNYGTIMGLMIVISTIGGLVSPVLAGYIFDTTHSYHLAWQIFTLITLPSIPLILLARPPEIPNNFTVH